MDERDKVIGTCKIWKGKPSVIVEFYCESYMDFGYVLESLKKTVPYKIGSNIRRFWQPEKKQWWIHYSQFSKVEAWATRHFYRDDIHFFTLDSKPVPAIEMALYEAERVAAKAWGKD